MTGGYSADIRVHSDLRLESGDLWVNLVANGRHLSLLTNDAGSLLNQLARTPLRPDTSVRRVIRGAGSTLDRAGLSAELIDSRGGLVRLGHGCGSLIGRLVFGSRHVRLGPARVIGASAYEYARSGRRGRRSLP